MKMSSLLKFTPSSSSSRAPSVAAKRKICQICDRSFANGKALGGHMRSHLVHLPLPVKSVPESVPTPEKSSGKVKRAANPGVRGPENARAPKADLKRSVGESTTVKSKSVSPSLHCLTEKEVALCLMKLMTEEWPGGVRPDIRVPLSRECKRRRGEPHPTKKEQFKDEDEEVDDDDDDDDVLFSVTTRRGSKKKSRRNKYKCETCHQAFRSYQALGGHRASHKNKRVKLQTPEEPEVDRSAGIRRTFKCPYCDKAFRSGQALGGHKKVHLSYVTNGTTPKSTDQIKVPTAKKDVVNHVWFDLNLPAPLE